MSILKSSNPAFNTFERFGEDQIAKSQSNTMSIGGTVSATSILLAIVTGVGVITWHQMVSGGPMTKFVYPVIVGSFVLGLVFSFMIYRKPKSARVIAPIHAVLEGVFVGAASYMIPIQFLGISADPATGNSMQMLIIQATLATFGVAAAMLAGYATGILRVGAFIKKVIITAGLGIVFYVGLLYLCQFLGIKIWSGFDDAGPIGIAFTIGCVVLGSLFLLLDFEFIEKGVKAGAPKHMEWVGAWGLMVTLVWLYIQVLRLLAKFASRD